MEVYIFIYTNIFSFFKFSLYNYHSINILLSWILHIHNYGKALKTKISILFTILLHKTLYLYNNLFLSNESVFKNHKHSLIN